MGESYWCHLLLIKELEFLVLISFVSYGFFNRRGKRFLFATLKSEVRVSKSFHIPLVMVWIHYRFGLLSTQSNLLSSLSFGKNLPHAMSPSWGFQLLGHAPLLQHRKNRPWAGPTRVPRSLGPSDKPSHVGSKRVTLHFLWGRELDVEPNKFSFCWDC